MSLSDDPDIKHQRGLIYYQMKNYRKSLNDFNNVAKSNDYSHKSTLYNYIGMCEGQLGNSLKSIEAHKKSLEYDPKFKEAKLNFAQIHKDLGNYDISGYFFFFFYRVLIVFFIFVSYFVVLCCVELNCIELYCVVLKCIVLHYIVSHKNKLN